MGTMTTTPAVKAERDYTRIPLKVLDAILDQMDAKANGMLEIQFEINFSMGGVTAMYATQKKTYK
jgi:hypothetical protein